MADHPEDAGKRWFARGQRVRVDAGIGGGIGIVQSTSPGGMHYVYMEDERRLITAPGTMLTAADDDPPAKTSGSRDVKRQSL